MSTTGFLHRSRAPWLRLGRAAGALVGVLACTGPKLEPTLLPEQPGPGVPEVQLPPGARIPLVLPPRRAVRRRPLPRAAATMSCARWVWGTPTSLAP
jgi:hypothetical protein